MGSIPRPHRLLLAGTFASVTLLAGCGGDGGGPTPVNVGEDQPVNLPLASFRVEDDLQWTVYRPFLRAITSQPSDPDQAEATAIVADIGRVMQPFIHWRSAEGEGAADYTSVRNPVDLMTRVIYTDRVGNFQDGRQSIAQAVDRGEPARYQNDSIRFTTDEPDQPAWNYILAWVYIAEAEGDDPTVDASEDIVNREIRNAVIRVILSPNAPGSQIAIFPARDFRTSGPQIIPDARITSFTLPVANAPEGEPQPVNPAATLNQSWLDREDLWTWTSEEAETFGSTDGIKCTHLRVDYAMDVAHFYSSDQPSRVGLGSADSSDGTSADSDNPRCGALNEDGNYRPADRTWALDAGNAPDRQ
jgi:hypothetical protein